MSEGSELHRPHPLSQLQSSSSSSSRRGKAPRDDDPISDNKNLQAAFDQLTRRQSESPGDAGKAAMASGSMPCSAANSNASFTQRRMERGGNVPSSFSSFEWERPAAQRSGGGGSGGLSSSAGSGEYDSSAYYGLSPFVTSSFMDLPIFERPGHGSGSNSSRYRSLSQRYQRERLSKGLSGAGGSSGIGGGAASSAGAESDDQDHRSTLSSSAATRSTLGKKGHEDSDIELSDDECKEARAEGGGGGAGDMLFQMDDSSGKATQRFDLMNPTSYDDDDSKTERGPSASSSTSTSSHHHPAPPPPAASAFPSGSKLMYNVLGTSQRPGSVSSQSDSDNDYDDYEDEDEDEDDSDTDTRRPPVRPEFARIKHMLTNYRPIPKPHADDQGKHATRRQQIGKLQHPAPRRHLLQTPVFQVVNTNTVKDRYLFLFNDLLLICKPIMDENIIDNASVLKGSGAKNGSGSGNGSGGGSGSTSSGGKYRLRHNENSLFQVKNIVELSKVTLYVPRDEQQQAPPPQSRQSYRPSMIMDRGDGRMSVLPAPRKMHPVLATALRKFDADPADGIGYLVEKQVLANEPLSIANFLFKTPDLSRRQLGNYVSETEHSDIYDAFLDCFRMVALRLDEALRILLMTLRLPSNWDALEYTIERFAKKWHDANQNVVKFHEDMVVKVVVAMLFLNAEFWYDADSEKDVFWHAREHKERRDRQRLLTRRASMIDRKDERGSVAIEPLHYISALRAKEGSTRPSLDEFLNRWRYYDQYTLVPVEFLKDMYQSIAAERLETGWDNGGNGSSGNDGDDDKDDDADAPAQDTIITVTPHRFPTSLTKGVPSTPITITIPAPDAGLQIKLRGQDLVCTPSVLDFSASCMQTFTITGHTLGRTSLMFIKSGYHASRYVSPSLPRTKSIVVERPFMRYTFQIGFSHADPRVVAAAVAGLKSPVGSPSPPQAQAQPLAAAAAAAADNEEPVMVKRKYTFSVETEQERKEWLRLLRDLCGQVQVGGGGSGTLVGKDVKHLLGEERVALQVLKEVLLADEFKKGTAGVTALSKVWGRSSIVDVGSQTNSPAKDIKDPDHLWVLQSPVKEEEVVFIQGPAPTATTSTATATANADTNDDATSTTTAPDRSSIVTTAATAKSTTNVVTKRGHEIIKLVVQNSMVPLMLGFLRTHIPQE